MRLGICTTDFQKQGARSLMKKIASMGFECVQLNFSCIGELNFEDSPEFEIPAFVDEGILALIDSAARETGLAIACVNGTFNCAHPDSAVRAEGIRRFEGFAEAVAYLKCPLVSICTGTRSTEGMWTPHPDNGAEEAYADMLDVVKAITAIAERHGLTLLIETEASNVVDTPEKAAALMDAVGSKNLKIVMDCANLFHAGEARRENVRPVIARAFELLSKDVRLAHAKDILPGAGIAFCPVGEGIVDYPFFLEKLAEAGYEGDMIIHGIYDEAKMPGAVRLLRAAIGGADDRR